MDPRSAPSPSSQRILVPPPALEPRQPQKNFVFVDEHNRHRRVKVMRACEGCRKRKIKCDAATTNTWPCASCQRLKMPCVPPSSTFEQDDGHDFPANEAPLSRDIMRHSDDRVPASNYIHSGSSQLGEPSRDYSATGTMARIGQTDTMAFTHSNFDAFQYSAMGANSLQPTQQQFPTPNQYQTVPAPASVMRTDGDDAWAVETGDRDLSDALNDLRINPVGVAPYMNRRALAEIPAMHEQEVQLPEQSTLTARIPSSMMPSDEEAYECFHYFFLHIHPYIPIINRAQFYRQWHSDRQSISPLILEGIFACTSQITRLPKDGSRWLALGSKHEESYKDIPRLSTIQGLLLLLKARETVPKSGYYYRSWMTTVNMIAMAKDLELDEHYEIHQQGGSCGSAPHECATKTRVWHMLFVVELMIGGPQGRTEFGVSLDSVDFKVPTSIAGMEDELQITQQFTQLMRAIRNVRQSSLVYAGLRRKKTDWANDLNFVAHNADFDRWTNDLPAQLQITYPPDGSAPWLHFHVNANVHMYHYLSIILHHRPQIQSTHGLFDGVWKQHMMKCYSAATKICRLQEAVLRDFGLDGLHYMQRGINFAIYCVLTSTMLHLVALTSPDPELNFEADSYFTRHMRILETCSSAWPMPEIQKQVDSLREAFSADINQPFELRANFPYGTPKRASEGDTPTDTSFVQDVMSTANQVSRTAYAASMAPPVQKCLMSHNNTAHAMVMMNNTAPNELENMQMSQQASQWNPTRIFDQWNTAFETPIVSYTAQQSTQAQLLPVSPSVYSSQAVSAAPATPSYTQQTQPNTNFSNFNPSSPQYSQHQQQRHSPPQSGFNPVLPNIITPSMWQDVVQRAYVDGAKRRWDDSSRDEALRFSKRTR